MVQEQMVLPVGAIVQDAHGEHYVIEGVLGKGGFSAVYKIRPRRAREQLYALKEVIDPDAEDRRILTTEAELLMRLNHPSLPHVYQVFENARLKRIYLLMDYIEGETLQQLQREQPQRRLPLSVIVALLTPVVDALDYLRSQHPPVVHRDIKPGNIIVPQGSSHAMLVDFGLAKEHVEDRAPVAFRYGTPGFAAPEQYKQGTNLRTDVYGLAATVYSLLTGTVPVDALSRIVERPEKDPLLRADQIYSAVPATVGKVIHHAMNLNASQRFASVHEFWQALCLAAEHPDVEPGFASTSMQVIRLTDAADSSSILEARKRHIRILLLLLIVLMVLGAVIDSVLWASYQVQHQQSPATLRIVMSTPSPSGQHGIPFDNNICALPTGSPSNTQYPQLSPCYEGTINDAGSDEKQTELYLSNIRQTRDTFTGTFRGLGLKGTLQGTVQNDGNVQFVVTVPGRIETLAFKGSRKADGALQGTFDVHSQAGRTGSGEHGNWMTQPLMQ